jgi:hypothetical protein
VRRRPNATAHRINGIREPVLADPFEPFFGLLRQERLAGLARHLGDE